MCNTCDSTIRWVVLTLLIASLACDRSSHAPTAPTVPTADVPVPPFGLGEYRQLSADGVPYPVLYAPTPLAGECVDFSIDSGRASLTSREWRWMLFGRQLCVSAGANPDTSFRNWSGSAAYAIEYFVSTGFRHTRTVPVLCTFPPCARRYESFYFGLVVRGDTLLVSDPFATGRSVDAFLRISP